MLVKTNGTLPPLNPFSQMERLFFGPLTDTFNRVSTFSPSVDVVEINGEIQVKCDLPGVKEQQIDIQLEDDTLTIAAEREEVTESPGVHLISERRYGRFERTFKLPAKLDRDKIQAKYIDGVLTITIPKREEARPRRIQILK